MGCLKLTGADDAAAVDVWKAGMRKLSVLPHVFVKLSFPTYIRKVRGERVHTPCKHALKETRLD